MFWYVCSHQCATLNGIGINSCKLWFVDLQFSSKVNWNWFFQKHNYYYYFYIGFIYKTKHQYTSKQYALNLNSVLLLPSSVWPKKLLSMTKSWKSNLLEQEKESPITRSLHFCPYISHKWPSLKLGTLPKKKNIFQHPFENVRLFLFV